MPVHRIKPQRFRATLEGTEKGRVYVALPFDAAKVWGTRDRYYVAGTINEEEFRGVTEQAGNRHLLPLGPAWRRGTGLRPGDAVDVVLALEGPHREDLAPDIKAAFDAAPGAAVAFDSIAPFYRKGALRWIDATKRSPDVRAARISEMIESLIDGPQKQDALRKTRHHQTPR